MFKRPFNPIERTLMKREYGKLINVDTISKLSMRKIIKLMPDENAKDIQLYLHLILNEWYELNIEDENIFRNIKKIIRNCKIEINIVESHNLSLIDERTFSRQRTVKDLEVEIELKQSESVGIKFLNAELLKLNNERYELLEGTLLISNRRIIFLYEDSEFSSFYWNRVANKQFLNNGFNFTYGRVKYIIRIHDQPTLNATINNLLDKRVK
ncbi:MAG: hypothetical protein KAG91_02225 [Mycoplasmataceae bacterium]|nr:hypothetical protein [Mycoplasmataceae bacterium]